MLYMYVRCQPLGSNMISGVLHVRLMSYIVYARTYVKQLQRARGRTTIAIVYTAYTVHFRRSTRLSSRVSHVTSPMVVTVSIVLFVLLNS